MSDEEKKLRIDSACKDAEQFTKLYYESFDHKRHLMNRFFMDKATLSWDGNPTVGKEAIQTFMESLPEMTHTITALDAQPVFIEAVKGQQTVLVQASGFIKLIKEKDTKGFTQTFLITAEDNKWKIVTDTTRLQITLNSAKIS